MLTKLENQPYMIVRDMQKAFPDNWFRYVEVEGEELRLRVLYLADTWDELLAIPDEEMKAEGVLYWGDAEGTNLLPIINYPLHLGEEFIIERIPAN